VQIKTAYVTILFFLASIVANGQDQKKMETLHLTVDNDAFLFSETDWYYSSGIYASYRRVINQESALVNLFPKKQKKVIRTVGIAHQVYTPMLFSSPLVQLYDRPHAAILRFDYGLSYANARSVFSVLGSLGWMGPAIGTGSMLVWFHGAVGWKTPRGWEYQISNSPVVQLSLDWKRTFYSDEGIDFSLIAEGEIGTVFVNSTAGLETRVGKFLPIGHSSRFDQFTDSRVPKKLIELFLVLGGSFEYVFYNATIEGGFIGPDSPHVETPTSWIRNAHFGLGLGGNRLDGMLLLNYRSATTREASRHKFVSIKLNYRL